MKRIGVRLALVLAGALIGLVALPRLFAPAAPPAAALQGVASGDSVRYDDALLADVLADIDKRTGFRAVAFPAVGGRRFSGDLVIGTDGKAAAQALASRMGLELRQAGPHWAVVDGSGR